MKAPVRNFIIRDATGTREAETLVIGRGISLSTTAGGLPELESLLPGQIQLVPSGGDDTQAIRDALARYGGVRLGPGIFTVSGTITLATGQGVAGCGSPRTTVRSTHAGAVFDLTGSGTSIQEMELRGPGDDVIGSRAVVATGATNIRMRGLRIVLFDRGVTLAQPSRVEVSQVKVLSVNAGFTLTGPGAQVSFANVDVDGTQGWGISSTSMECVSFAGVTLNDCAPGLRVSQGGSHALKAIRATCAIELLSTQGVEMAGVNCLSRLRVQDSAGVAIIGCSLQGLLIDGGEAITASGIRSETTGSGAHVVVQGGATGVAITGIHHVNPATPPTYEVDVSAAGGRVVFIQHDFDPARINSGSNFAAL